MTGRTGGMLTNQDIEFLMSENYYEGETARQMRYQRRSDIRGRIVSCILDFDIVRSYLSKEERDKIFTEPEKNGAESEAEFEESLDALLGWIYLGCRDDSNIDFESLLEYSVGRAEEEYHQAYRDQPIEVSVDLDIEVTKKYTKTSKLAKMLEEGEPVKIDNIYKLPMIDEVPIDPDNVDKIKVESTSRPKRLEKEKKMIESILKHHLGIEAEVKMESTQAHITDEELELDRETTAAVPPEDFESRE